MGKSKFETIHFKQQEPFSPYVEFANMDDAENGMQSDIVMNGFYRFESIMEPLFMEKKFKEKQKQWMFDIFMHYLLVIESQRGMTFQDMQVFQEMEQLKDGVYGDETRRCFCVLNKQDQYCLAHGLFRQNVSGVSVDKFADTLVVMLGTGVVYGNKNKEKQLLVYTGVKKNDEDINKIKLVEQLMLPIGYELKVFWNRHFAVVGEACTMHLDKIELL